jgi:hypothetical protein
MHVPRRAEKQRGRGRVTSPTGSAFFTDPQPSDKQLLRPLPSSGRARHDRRDNRYGVVHRRGRQRISAGETRDRYSLIIGPSMYKCSSRSPLYPASVLPSGLQVNGPHRLSAQASGEPPSSFPGLRLLAKRTCQPPSTPPQGSPSPRPFLLTKLFHPQGPGYISKMGWITG